MISRSHRGILRNCTNYPTPAPVLLTFCPEGEGSVVTLNDLDLETEHFSLEAWGGLQMPALLLFSRDSADSLLVRD